MKSVEQQARAQDTTGTVELSVKLLPKTEGLFRVRFATDTTDLIEQEDGVENRVGIEGVTKMPRGSGDTVTPARSGESDAQVATPSAEYVVDRIFGHCTMRGGTQYQVRRYGYTASDDTYEPCNGLGQLFIDRYLRTRQQGKTRRA